MVTPIPDTLCVYILQLCSEIYMNVYIVGVLWSFFAPKMMKLKLMFVTLYDFVDIIVEISYYKCQFFLSNEFQWGGLKSVQVFVVHCKSWGDAFTNLTLVSLCAPCDFYDWWSSICTHSTTSRLSSFVQYIVCQSLPSTLQFYWVAV